MKGGAAKAGRKSPAMEEQEFGLTHQQQSVLEILKRQGTMGTGSGDIARKLRVAQSSVIADLAALEGLGLARNKAATWRATVPQNG